MSRPRLLDLFCKAGGAAMGYHRAGFDVVGIDIRPQPNYPFTFYRADALAMTRDIQHGCWHESHSLSRLEGALYACLGEFDAVHASPPCQGYSTTASLHSNVYAKLIGDVRDMLNGWGIPYVIENVAGARADMINPVQLCGSSFGLGVRRHRLFETSWPVALTPPCAHYLQPEPVDVTGTGASRSGPRLDGRGGNSRKPRNLAHAREVMDIDWMTRPELAEAIPPAFTEHLGAQLLAHLSAVAA